MCARVAPRPTVEAGFLAALKLGAGAEIARASVSGDRAASPNGRVARTLALQALGYLVRVANESQAIGSMPPATSCADSACLDGLSAQVMAAKQVLTGYLTRFLALRQAAYQAFARAGIRS